MAVQAIIPFTAAVGDSPAVTLPCAPTVTLCPPDHSVPSNKVIITGNGTISSFGPSQVWMAPVPDPSGDPDDSSVPPILVPQITGITKTVKFQPTAPGITLKHDPLFLKLLGNQDRVITAEAIGTYSVDEQNYWCEESYADTVQPPTQGSGMVLGINYYTASQTITIPKLATRAWARMWGGTGASGSVGGNATGYSFCSGGTGAGGYLEKFLTGLTPGNTLTFTLGAAGVAGAGNGGNGGASTLASGTQTIPATLTANGSTGSQSSSGSFGTTGTPGGTASGGDVNMTGQTGTPPWVYVVDQASGQATMLPGVGGAGAFSRGADGAHGGFSGVNGNPGNPGGLIIAWFSEPKF